MNKHLLTAIGAAALLAACSSGGSDGLEGNGNGDQGGGDQNNGGPGPGGGDGTGATSTQASNIPATGPGSLDSAGHKFFVASVFPKLVPCNSCHSNGSQGAPMFLQGDANTAYQALDARGLIQPTSLLLSKGSHASGGAPALTTEQTSLIQQWLALEATDRSGMAATVNVLEKIGACLDETKFDAIKFDTLRTTRRDNENANTCTGCNQAPCRTCHTGGDGGFYMGAGSKLDDNTFTETKTPKFITKYIGLNGTQAAASNAIQSKSDATKTDKPYSHPMFTLTPEMKTALDAFVTDAITRYNAKQCGQ